MRAGWSCKGDKLIHQFERGLTSSQNQMGEMRMKLRRGLIFTAGIAVLAATPTYAYEAAPAQTKAGAFIGASAGVPPPGIYMFNQVFTLQGNLAGPATKTVGNKVGVQAFVDAQGFLFVPGWSFLGATYDAVLVQPFVSQSLGSPVNSQQSGMFNTYVVPVELSWNNIGNSGFGVKTGLGIYMPDGTKTGIAGTGNVGSPYWTFQPEIIVSYLADGWNLSAAVYQEFNTASSVTGYTTGNILHADFTATKTIGKWTFGPVAYYQGQVSKDKSSAFYGNAILNANTYDIWAVGGLVGYNFGVASLSVWATDEVSAKASGATSGGAVDMSAVPKGFTVFATLSYRLWAPDEPAATPTRPVIHK